MSNNANELFLLFTNLSQFKSKELVIQIFVDGINSLFPNKGFVWNAENTSSQNILVVCTRQKTYGYINYSEPCNITDEELSSLQNATQLLAIILENIEQDLFLNDQKKHLNYLVEEKTKDLIKSQTELEERNQEIENFFTSAIDLLCIANTEGYFMRLNKEWENVLGYSTDELLGKQFLEFIHPDDLESTLKAIEQLNNQIVVSSFTNRYKSKDGSYKWIEWKSYPHGNKIFSAARDITNKVLTEKELLESKEQLHFAFEGSNDGLWDLNVNTGEFYISPRSCEILGYFPAEKENLLKVWENLINPDDKAQITERYNAHLSGKTPVFEVEHRMMTKNGEWKWILSRGKIVSHTQDGKPQRITGTHTDISKSKNIEEKLIKQDALHVAMIANIGDVIGIIGLDGLIKYKSPNIEKAFGWKPEDMIGRDAFVAVHPDDKERIQKEFYSLFTSDNALTNVEYRYLCKYGGYKWVELTAINNIANPDINGILINYHDISSRIQTAEDLLKSEAMIRTAVENLPIIFYLIDHKGIFQLSIGAGLKGLGLKPNEVVGMSVFDIYKDFPVIINSINKALAGESNFFESNINNISHFNSVSPFITSPNDLPGIVGVALDITERKIAELEIIKAKERAEESERDLKAKNEEYESLNEELNQTNEELFLSKEKAEESDRLKTAFLQNMSHEIRTPMNAIMGFAQLMPVNIENAEKLTMFSSIITQRCEDLLTIIDDILDIAKIESGQLTLNTEVFKIDSLFSELQAFFIIQQERLNKKHIHFSFEVSPEIKGLNILSDKGKLKQIFINLISNAFKFTDNGHIEGGCKLNDKHELVFHVKDSGIGIPSDKYDIIFERFSQIDRNNKRLYGGTGLGLPIVKGLVELMGGKVWLESQIDVGTTFYFTIDYKKHDDFEPFLDEKQSNIHSIHVKNKTILIVEDDKYNMSFINEVLSENGIKLFFAETGKQAIQKAKEHMPDLILMDIGLPDMTGYHVIRQILVHTPSAKIIAQTAYAASSDKQKAFQSGCIDYISKPLRIDELISVVNKHL